MCSCPVRLRSVNEALGYPRKKKKKAETRDNWVGHYPMTLGLRPVVAADTGKVEQAVCRFCENFKREGKIVQAEELSLILNGDTRGPCITTAIFVKFRRDNIVHHLKSQHKTRWAEYQKLLNNPLIRTAFSQPKILEQVFSRTCPTRVVSVLLSQAV
ncbi:hypothetical protein PHYSODRAFT_308283 [Phytophthora sojae]|uniref:Uncharacterized protein n=1 Tax=Phytophthora sojae (strain P6497) TaxID=1094619 RepID=G5AJF6_PHYSP|nr:hypothetical protein PHYSODRAFT_308283 [Phytophthora sojae]EGZ04345.1 hypothetical protein PHYSODRAFT_308283 [Phytophthora sojae]|eukprot:XP_009540207.1 hypothetical protein PHYSODRAFT_308283 [Phytophthora sojae]